MGIKMVTSSRDAEEFRKAMKVFGKVDVVLNSLSDNFINYSADMIVDGGHFCEIGKRGIWSKEKFQSEYPNINYHIIAVDVVMETDTERFKHLLDDTIEFGASPICKKMFNIVDIVKAFQFMRDAKHIGKVVISQPPLFGDGTYIITGGLGYMGKLVAKGMVEYGAKRVVLVSSTRSKLPEDMQELNNFIKVEKCDVSELNEVQKLISCDTKLVLLKDA